MKLFNNNKLKKNYFVLSFSIIMVIFFTSAAMPVRIKTPIKKYVDNEVLVKFKDNVSAKTKSAVVGNIGGKKIKEFAGKRLQHIKLNEGQSVEKAVESYKDNPNVEYAQPNFIYRISAVPNDPSYSQLWGLHNTGQTISDESYYPEYSDAHNPGTSGKDMDMQTAWDYKTDCSSVVVAVIDTGVNYNNEDLTDNMWDDGSGNYGFDYIDNDNDPMDLNGHGTHVAGTIGARGNNGVGVTGVCWNAKIMAVRCLDAAGSGSTSDIISGLNYAVTNGARVVNFSLGILLDTSLETPDKAFSDAIDDARTAGVLIIAAAGNEENNNDGTLKAYPASYTQDNIISVAALDQAYTLAEFSNYGLSSVDVGAPGTNVLSTFAGAQNSITDDFHNTYGELDWNTAGDDGWDYVISDDFFSGYDFDYLVFPGDWPNGNYGNDLDAQVYKTFSLTGNEVNISLFFVTKFDFLSGDEFYVYFSDSAGNPISEENLNFNLLDIIESASTGGDYYGFDFYLNDFTGSNYCSIGFQILTDSSGTSSGAGIVGRLSGYNYYLFSIDTLTLNNSSYYVASGTSMAAPHTAGLAAMILAYNPKYTYLDAINSIKNGGENVSALSGKTTSGKAINAWGSLRYINQVTGLTITAI